MYSILCMLIFWWIRSSPFSFSFKWLVPKRSSSSGIVEIKKANCHSNLKGIRFAERRWVSKSSRSKKICGFYSAWLQFPETRKLMQLLNLFRFFYLFTYLTYFCGAGGDATPKRMKSVNFQRKSDVYTHKAQHWLFQL